MPVGKTSTTHRSGQGRAERLSRRLLRGRVGKGVAGERDLLGITQIFLFVVVGRVDHSKNAVSGQLWREGAGSGCVHLLEYDELGGERADAAFRPEAVEFVERVFGCLAASCKRAGLSNAEESQNVRQSHPGEHLSGQGPVQRRGS